MPRKASPPRKPPHKPLPPEELARDAVAHEEEAAGGKVRMTFRVVLPRPVAEALVARAIQAEKNLEMLVTEILEAAAKKGNG
jgi:hypothetical protein